MHNIKEIPYLCEKKPNNLPAWKTQEEMVAWVRLEYQNEDKKDSHAPGMVEDMLDLFAVPNPGTTYYANKDFTGFIKYFATWSLPVRPESEAKTGLSGGRHFMGTLLYPDFFKPQRSSFIRHKFKDTYEQKKFPRPPGEGQQVLGLHLVVEQAPQARPPAAQGQLRRARGHAAATRPSDDPRRESGERYLRACCSVSL